MPLLSDATLRVGATPAARAYHGSAPVWAAPAAGPDDPLATGLPAKFYTDFASGFVPDVFEPLGGGKPYTAGANAYLQPDGSTNVSNKEMQWMRPDNVKIRASQYDAGEGNVLALVTRRDGYTTTLAANRTDAAFDYLVTHPNPRAGRDAEGDPVFPYTGGMVTTQQDKLTTGGRPLAVSGAKDWIASARMRWTQANGYWPAFWMYPDDSSYNWLAEYDVMEDFSPRVFGPNIVVANMFKNGTQLPYNAHKVRSLDLSAFHTWVVRHDLTASEVTPGAKRLRVYVDGVVFFDSDFYRDLGQLDDTWFYAGTMHFRFQGAQIGGTGSNGSLVQGDDGWRDLDTAGVAALPLVMEVSEFGVWEDGATLAPLEPVDGHPVLGDPDTEPELEPLPEPEPVAYDDFTGTDGANIDTAKWAETTNAVPSATILSNQARLTTGTTGNYANADKNQIRSKGTSGTFAAGTVSFRGVGAETLIEARWGVFAAASGSLPSYSFRPPNGYGVEYDESSRNLWVYKYVNEAATALVTTTAPSLTALGSRNRLAADRWNIDIEYGPGGVRAWVWLTGGTRPATPNLAPGATDTTYTSGTAGAGIQGGGTTAVRALLIDSVAFDPT